MLCRCVSVQACVYTHVCVCVCVCVFVFSRVCVLFGPVASMQGYMVTPTAAAHDCKSLSSTYKEERERDKGK